MKLWKIGLYSCCILIILYWFFYGRNEGFQSIDNSVLNVPYTSQYKEVFLVAPNDNVLPSYLSVYADTLNADGTLAPNTFAQGNNLSDSVSGRTYYTDASTLEDAKATCASFGGTLASPAQLEIAAQLGGYWTVASWATDGKQYALIPPQTSSYSVPNTLAKTSNASSSSGSTYDPLRQFTSPVPKAFPACWGVKPPEPALNIIPFNQIDYSMFTQGLLSTVMNPASTDLIQVSFTPDQAVYALQQNNYNINNPTNPARAFLVNNLGSSSTSVNDQIYRAAVGSQEYSDDKANLTIAPCTILLNTYNSFQTQFGTLVKIMQDISGGVVAMESAKAENAKFQMSLESVCEIESPTTSPACAKLATLDFDLLYSTSGGDMSTSRLASLELLNVTLLQRQHELCMAMNALFQVQKYVGCASLKGSGPIGIGCKYSSTGSDPTTGSSLGSAWFMDGLQPNNEAYLKILLQQISPYFAVSTYQSLLNGIIGQLELTIELPTLNDYNTSAKNFQQASEGITNITGFLAYASGSSA